MFYFLVYIACISLFSIFACIYDKWAANHRPKKRVKEATLLILSALGGSAAMLLCMLLIRHKTKHPKFMVGIPLIIAVQVTIAFALYWFFLR